MRLSRALTVRTFVHDAQKISMRATKRLLLIPHCFDIIKIREHFGLRPAQYTPPRSHFTLLPYQLIAKSFVMPLYPYASLKVVLESSPIPKVSLTPSVTPGLSQVPDAAFPSLALLWVTVQEPNPRVGNLYFVS